MTNLDATSPSYTSPMPTAVPVPALSAPPTTGRLETAPPGTPYHRLARTATHRWWKPLLGTVFVFVGGFVAMIVMFGVVSVAGYAMGRPIGPDGLPVFGDAANLGIELLGLGLFTPFVLLAARWVQRRPAGTISSVTGRLRLGWLGLCLLIALPAIVVTLAVDGVLLTATGNTISDGPESWVGTGRFLAVAAMLLVLVPLQAGAEEYVCRGWLLQAAGTFARRPWHAIAVQAPVFAIAHGLGTPWGFADLTVFGLVLGWLAVRTGGIEAGIALHLMNNLVAMLLGAAFGGLAEGGTAADSPWEMFVVAAGVNVGYAALVAWLARRRRVAVTVPAE